MRTVEGQLDGGRLCDGVWALAFELDGRPMRRERIPFYAVYLLRCARWENSSGNASVLIRLLLPNFIPGLSFLGDGANDYNRA